MCAPTLETTVEQAWKGQAVLRLTDIDVHFALPGHSELFEGPSRGANTCASRISEPIVEIMAAPDLTMHWQQTPIGQTSSGCFQPIPHVTPQ